MGVTWEEEPIGCLGVYFPFSDLNTLVFSVLLLSQELLSCLPLLLGSPGLYIFFVDACLIYEVFHLTIVYDTRVSI